jgi:hypothetical protein
MEIRKEQRVDYPLLIENIGLGKWHVRWDVRGVIDEQEDEDEVSAHYEYNEVTLDHEPGAEEVQQITAN